MTTEFYRSYDVGTLGYAIVAGLARCAGEPAAHADRVDGEHYTLISSGGARIVTWVQDGHTCVLASRSASAATLLRLAVAQARTPVAPA